jgi:hypothetical protein
MPIGFLVFFDRIGFGFLFVKILKQGILPDDYLIYGMVLLDFP